MLEEQTIQQLAKMIESGDAFSKQLSTNVMYQLAPSDTWHNSLNTWTAYEVRIVIYHLCHVLYPNFCEIMV